VTHLDFHFEFIRIALDELTKIDPTFCCVEKDGFATITLYFNIRNLHLKIQRKGNGSGPF
jgi:hypothetical protein